MRRVRWKGSQVATDSHFVVDALENIQIKSVHVKNAGGLIISFSVIPAFVASVTLTRSIECG